MGGTRKVLRENPNIFNKLMISGFKFDIYVSGEYFRSSTSNLDPVSVTSKGCSSSGIKCSNVSPWGHKSCHQTCSSKGFSLPKAAGPPRSLLQCGLPWSHCLFWASICTSMGFSTNFWWTSAPMWNSMGRRGTSDTDTSLLTHLGACRAVSHIFSLFSPGYICAGDFSPSLTMLSQRQCYPH